MSTMDLPLALAIMFTISGLVAGQLVCTRQDLDECTSIGEPLLRDSNFVFPTDNQKVQKLCGAWAEFVKCIRRYLSNCVSEKKRQEFNYAVAEPISAVHQLCTDNDYKRQFLQHAPCMSNITKNKDLCGNQFNFLVDQVSGRSAPDVLLCCSHHKYRDCLLTKTNKICRQALDFARSVIDKSMSLVTEHCKNYIHSGDCPGYQEDTDLLGIGSLNYQPPELPPKHNMRNEGVREWEKPINPFDSIDRRQTPGFNSPNSPSENLDLREPIDHPFSSTDSHFDYPTKPAVTHSQPTRSDRKEDSFVNFDSHKPTPEEIKYEDPYYKEITNDVLRNSPNIYFDSSTKPWVPSNDIGQPSAKGLSGRGSVIKSNFVILAVFLGATSILCI